MYAQRDTEALGDYYLRHVDAMTTEGLHLKSAIAAELAWRDAEIEALRAKLAALPKTADNVEIVPGMTVYAVPKGFPWVFEAKTFGRVDFDGSPWIEARGTDPGVGETGFSASNVYSTRAAAELAAKAVKS